MNNIRRGTKSTWARLGALTLACLAASLFTTACNRNSTSTASSSGSAGNTSQAAARFNAVDITGADYANRLKLTDADGHVRDLASFKGQVVFVFFGYTQCPDVCPTTMAELAEVRRRLGEDGKRVQGVFVTLDPERDTAPVLKHYLAAMDPGFVGLRGSASEIQNAARDFKVFFQKVPTKDGGYTLDHTAGAFVFDPDGQVRLFVRYGLGADALTADLKRLLAASPAKAPAKG